MPWPPLLSGSFFSLNILALHVQYGIQAFVSRMHLITSQRTSISKNFPEEHVPETPKKSAPFAVLMGAKIR